MKIKIELYKLMLTFVFSLTVMPFSFSQKVNYDALFESISDSTSQLFYPKLFDRFQQGDPELQVEDYRALYYGFTFHEAYRPYDRNPLDQKISDLMGEGISEETAPKLVAVSKQYLSEQPFNLKMNYYLRNFLKSQGKDSVINILQTQYDGVVDAILSTGDGLSLETAYTVNHPSDEYMVLQELELKPVDHLFETASDYFKVDSNEENIEGVYFDVYQMAKIGSAQIGVETIEVQDEEIPDGGVEVGSEDEILSFIPLGFQALSKVSADFDADGDQDWMMVLNKEGEEVLSNSAAGDPEKRVLIFLERAEDGLLKEVWRNENVIPCIDCGDGNEDPFISFDFESEKIRLFSQGGGLFVWERETVFEFIDGRFQLVKESFSSYRKGNKDDAQTDVETVDDFGVVYLDEFDFYKLME